MFQIFTQVSTNRSEHLFFKTIAEVSTNRREHNFTRHIPNNFTQVSTSRSEQNFFETISEVSTNRRMSNFCQSVAGTLFQNKFTNLTWQYIVLFSEGGNKKTLPKQNSHNINCPFPFICDQCDLKNNYHSEF